jgi:DNA-binding NarL/FixJ family response regulator
MRTGVRMALEREGIDVCAEASSAPEAVEAALRERPDACLLDVHMPGGGTSAASMISAQLPGTVVLMLTDSRDDEDLFESLRRGAVGYLLKDMDGSRLAFAVRAALHGEVARPAVGPESAEAATAETPAEAAAPALAPAPPASPSAGLWGMLSRLKHAFSPAKRGAKDEPTVEEAAPAVEAAAQPPAFVHKPSVRRVPRRSGVELDSAAVIAGSRPEVQLRRQAEGRSAGLRRRVNTLLRLFELSDLTPEACEQIETALTGVGLRADPPLSEVEERGFVRVSLVGEEATAVADKAAAAETLVGAGSGDVGGDPAAVTSPRVLIADDHAPMRAGVRMALEREGIDVCAEVASAPEAVEAALRERPDACLLDIHMPGGGTSAASMISSQLPGTVVLMLTVSRNDEDLFESLRRGAVGYLLKDMDGSRLAFAVRAALHGEAALPRSLAARLIGELRQGRPTPRLTPLPGRAELTRREWDVLELLCEGAGTAEIAKRLFLSPVTVRRHVSAIVGKLGVSSREEAVQLAMADEAFQQGAHKRG